MKNSGKIISVLLAGGLVGGLTAQNLDHVDVLRTDPFGNLAEAFANDVNELFQGTSSFYTDFTFGWDGANKATGTIVKGVAAVTGQPVELAFSLIPNVASVYSDTSVFVAYLGNESGDDNFFGYIDPSGTPNTFQGLYNYKGGNNNPGAPDDETLPDPNYSKPSVSDEVFDLAGIAGGTGTTVTFWHEDRTDTPGNIVPMIDAVRFRTFSATNTVIGAPVNGVQTVTTTTYYILGADDRQSFDVDFDDGLFLIAADEIVERISVPEPSSIGLLAVGLLAGLGITRRSRRNS